VAQAPPVFETGTLPLCHPGNQKCKVFCSLKALSPRKELLAEGCVKFAVFLFKADVFQPVFVVSGWVIFAVMGSSAFFSGVSGFCYKIGYGDHAF
jgi:hypothetical protein